MHRLLSLSTVLCLVNCLFSSPASAQEIWFGTSHAVDLMSLFAPDAPWREAASRVKVFLLGGAYMNRAPQADIDRLVADLNRRHIAIALGVGVMESAAPATHPACGGQGLVEGYGRTQLARLHVAKIKHAGGVISYIAMDEPLWFGHYFNGHRGGQPGCHSSIPEILDLIRGPLAVYAEAFPGLILGDTEPTDIAEQPAWQSDLATFASGFRRQTGRPLAFMHLDTPFKHPGEEGLTVAFYRAVEQLKQQGLVEKIGVIYDGTPDDRSDAAWVSDAEAHVHLLEDKDHLHPGQAVIFSWMDYPQHALPESSPGSLTGLVDFYAARTRQTGGESAP